MNKTYFNDILNSDLLQLGFYFVLFAFCLLFFLKIFNIRNLKTKIIVLAFFTLYNALLVLDYKFNFIPFLPDSNLYYTLFKTGRDYPGMSKSLIGFYHLIKILRVLFIENILVYISFQILVYFVSVFIIFKAWLLINDANRKNAFEQIYFILAFLLPSAVLYHLVPLRECFSTLGFSVALYFLILMFKNKSNFSIGFIGGLFIIMMTRIQVAFYFILSFIGVKFSLDKHIIRKVAAVIFGVTLFTFAIYLTNYQINPEKLGAARNFRVLKYPGSYGPVEWHSFTDIFMSSPLLIAQFLFSPLPILHGVNPLEMKLIFLDAMLMLMVWFFLIFNLKDLILNYKVWLLLMIIYLFLFGIYEFHIGGAVRHRLPLSLMTIAMAAQYISTSIYNFNKKLNS